MRITGLHSRALGLTLLLTLPLVAVGRPSRGHAATPSVDAAPAHGTEATTAGLRWQLSPTGASLSLTW